MKSENLLCVLDAAAAGLASAWPILTSDRRRLVDSARRELSEVESEVSRLRTLLRRLVHSTSQVEGEDPWAVLTPGELLVEECEAAAGEVQP